MIDETMYTFEECIQIANESGLPKHILLGNGFSISFDPQFNYEALVNKLDKPLRDIAQQQNNNIEEAISIVESEEHIFANERLRHTHYEKSLLSAVVQLHPRSFIDIDSRYLEKCYFSFLQYFNMIFTTNFDLLLYSVVIHFRYNRNIKKLTDGFYNAKDGDGKTKFIWRDNKKTSLSSHIWYLHGGIHLFVNKEEKLYSMPLFSLLKEPTIRLVEDRTTIIKQHSLLNKTLIQQITEKFNNDEQPLIIIEKNYNSKYAKIHSHKYFEKAYNYLHGIKQKGRNQTSLPDRSLFIFGHSLSEKYDGHIVHAVSNNLNTKHIFIGIHCSSSENISADMKLYSEKLYSKVHKECQSRNIYFFDSSKMDIWGKK